MSKDMYGIKAPKKLSFTDPISAGVNMEQQNLNNHVNVRNQYDEDAELFTNLSKIPGDKPRSGAEALFKGFAEGAAYGSKSRSTEKKQEALSKYDKVADYYRQIVHQTNQMNEWYQKREFAKKKYMPQVLAYAENINKLDPQSQRMMAQGILDGWNRSTGDDFKLNTIDGSDPFVMTISSDKGTQIIDIRDMFAGDEALQQRLAMKTPEYQMKIQQERQDKTRKAELEADEFELKKYKEGVDSKFGQKEDSESNEWGSIPLSKLKGRGAAPLLSSATAEMNLAKEVPVVLDMLKEGEDIIGKNPNLGSGWVNAVGPHGITKTLLDNPTREAYEKLNKIANRVAEAYIKAKGSSISDSERETIKKGLFDVTNLSGSNQYNINSVRKELNIAKERGDFTGNQLSQGLVPTPTSFEKFKKSKQNPQTRETGETKIIRTPEGKKIRIPESYLDQAIANGAEVIG